MALCHNTHARLTHVEVLEPQEWLIQEMCLAQNVHNATKTVSEPVLYVCNEWGLPAQCLGHQQLLIETNMTTYKLSATFLDKLMSLMIGTSIAMQSYSLFVSA